MKMQRDDRLRHIAASVTSPRFEFGPEAGRHCIVRFLLATCRLQKAAGEIHLSHEQRE